MNKCNHFACLDPSNRLKWVRKLGELLNSQPENSDMNQQQTPASSVTSSLISQTRRMTALPRYFGRFMGVVEGAVFDALGELCKDYKGGSWEFYELSNGGFFMAPTGAEKYSLSCAGNWFDGELSAEATGIVASLVGINRACWSYKDQMLIDRFYALREFALDHPEASLIMAAID